LALFKGNGRFFAQEKTPCCSKMWHRWLQNDIGGSSFDARGFVSAEAAPIGRAQSLWDLATCPQAPFHCPVQGGLQDFSFRFSLGFVGALRNWPGMEDRQGGLAKVKILKCLRLSIAEMCSTQGWRKRALRSLLCWMN